MTKKSFIISAPKEKSKKKKKKKDKKEGGGDADTTMETSVLDTTQESIGKFN